MGPLLNGEAEVVSENVTWRGEHFLEHKGTREGAKSGPLLVFANKVLLAQSYAHFKNLLSMTAFIL